MADLVDITIPLDGLNVDRLLADWRWAVPRDATPLILSVFGNWVFGAPDGSIWLLHLVDGDFVRLATNAAEFNQLKRDPSNENWWFMRDWADMCYQRGIWPQRGECLGFKVQPILGGPFAIDNIQPISLLIYQSFQGQLHRQIRKIPEDHVAGVRRPL